MTLEHVIKTVGSTIAQGLAIGALAVGSFVLLAPDNSYAKIVNKGYDVNNDGVVDINVEARQYIVDELDNLAESYSANQVAASFGEYVASNFSEVSFQIANDSNQKDLVEKLAQTYANSAYAKLTENAQDRGMEKIKDYSFDGFYDSLEKGLKTELDVNDAHYSSFRQKQLSGGSFSSWRLDS